ncbi:MAG: hypothetical protein Q7T18_10060, partial [Sedimentisphaerales bacterium]|nr:hypothetical protein [Sedimentisphaerales bacterium]
GLFLGLLELVREKLIWAEQEQSLASIYLKPLTDVPAAQAVKEAMLATAVEESQEQQTVPPAPESEMLGFDKESEMPQEPENIGELDSDDLSPLPTDIEESDNP